MANTIGLDDDLDPVEILMTVDRNFDITVTDDEAECISTVGELHDLLLSKIPANPADNKCASAMTFYRIRAALRRLGFAHDLSPGSDMRILERGSLQSNIAALQVDSGFLMPDTVATRVTGLASLCGFAASCAAFWLWQPSPSGLGWLGFGFGAVLIGLIGSLIAASLAFGFFDPGQLPKDCATLGQFARRVAAMNCGSLIKMGARHRDEDIWDSLVDTLLQFSGSKLPKPEVARNTYLLANQLK